MKPTPSLEPKSPNGPVIASLLGQLLTQLVSLAGYLGELKAETRVQHQHHERRLTEHTGRITALEGRMDTMGSRSPEARRESTSTATGRRMLSLVFWGEAAKAAWGLVRLVPWGGIMLMGAAAWNWLVPFLNRLLAWLPF